MSENPEEHGVPKQLTKMSVDFDRWYTDVIRLTEMADYSGVRGCMVIRPYGYAMWELIQRAFDDMIKESGHENAYFPLLIPHEYFMKEAEHVEGFAPEVAWVQYAGPRPVLTPPSAWTDAEKAQAEEGWLAQPLVIRPTSETIIGPIMKRYIQSHRDLPQLLNQWCNVLRWEMRTRLFLRTSEFLWQEGHTFHATGEEAGEEVLAILENYRSLAEDWLAIPVIQGRKTEGEKFAGAEYTTSIEAMMRDGLALQAGTSHYFGQNFTRAYDIAFTNRENQRELAYTTSWGMSTRTIGGLVMAHGDDSGLVLPPRIAPVQVAIVPIFRDEDSRRLVEDFLRPLTASLKSRIRFKVEWRDERPGNKYAHWEVRGVPLRVEVGPRDIEAGQVMVVDRLSREKTPTPVAGLAERLGELLDEFHARLFQRALDFRAEHTFRPGTKAELREIFVKGNGFAWAAFCDRTECEAEIKAELGVTARNKPFAVEGDHGRSCVWCDQPAAAVVIFARSY
ncbi:MAG TPA: aminoacyl--tRNA ligase-related protein [Myxococcaceae bacterium]|nr:aminoacyl--tRNA ligase-related protein [Myxococcaceae bacterium]